MLKTSDLAMSEPADQNRGVEQAPGRAFAHKMLREIFEQPRALEATLGHYLDGHGFRAAAFSPALDALFKGRSALVIAASGSSRHAGLAGEILIEDFAGLPVDVEYASEYSYRSRYALQQPGVLVISQSGETADTLAALREARAAGLPVIAIANVADSSMAREADFFLPTLAGTEHAIPATKSFTTQLAVLYLLGLYLARERKAVAEAEIGSLVDALVGLPEVMRKSLPEWERATRTIAASWGEVSSVLLLGRGIHYAIAREGALKIKESSYLQAEGYATGELKHGPNALVTPESPLLVLATCDPGDAGSRLRYGKTLHLMRDMRAQKAQIVAIVTEGDREASAVADQVIFVPQASEHLAPMLEVVPLQLLAYALAVERGIDVDHPRNLVKSVTRE